MNEIYGYGGKVLRIDLTNEKVTEEKLDEATLRKWVGGTGLGAKYLYEEVPAGVGWADEENRIIISSGPLGGTRIAGSGTVSVVTKGALTNGAVATQANGYFGAYLRLSGFEGIILQGKAKRWLYLSINGGQVEFKDASALLGKDTWETNDIVRKELGATERGVAVASIGPAGENLVKFAALLLDKGHIASKDGVGAVMGSKRLKAIVIARGKGGPVMKDKDLFAAIAGQFHENIVNNPHSRGSYEYGTLNGVISSVIAKNGIVPVRNYTTNVFDIAPDLLDKYSGTYIRTHFEPKPNSCWACPMHHGCMITLTEGPFKGYVGEEPEYETLAAFGPVIGVTDATATIFLANEADRLGIDSNETGWVLGLAIECYEKGILTSADTDGLELTWGNYNAVNELIHKIARREGFGAILAEGAMRAAQKIGKEAPSFALHTMKGNTPRGHDHRNNWGRLLDTCVSQMGTDEGNDVLKSQDVGVTLAPLGRPNNSAADSISHNVAFKGAGQFEDCIGTCRMTTRTDLKLICEAISAATGWDFTALEGMEVGKRIVNQLRCFNLRHGHTAAMDAPSPRYGSAPVDGPSKGVSIMPLWNELRSKYYEGMGWDKETGKPLPETLKRYGLEYAIPELWGKQ